MKYRKSYFSSLLASDYAKLTYLELLVNTFTDFYIAWFLCDVMTMTTKEWLLLPIRVCVVLPLLPLVTILNKKAIYKMSLENDGGWVSYDGIYIYWRDVSDFNSKPTSYLSK